jgi:preprotein translocase subunit SecG
MGFLLGLLSVALVLNCIVLVLLVLIQLPKKEAGLGLAFGGGAADALFGAGSGNVLTKATKYSAVLFFVLCIVLGLLQGRYFHRNQTEFNKALQKDIAAPAVQLPPTTPTTIPTPPKPAAESPATATPAAVNTITTTPAATTTPLVVPKPATNAAPAATPAAPPAAPPPAPAK